MRPYALIHFVRLNKGVSLYCNDHHLASEEIRYGDFYEHWMLDAIERLNIKGNYADIGCHNGHHSVFFGKYCPAETIFAFDPTEENRQWYKKNMELNGVKNTRLEAMAMGSEIGKCLVNIPPLGDQVSTGGTTISTNKGVILVTTIDHYFQEIPLSLVKIDVEGHELEVIKGGMKVFKRDKPEIFVECMHLPTWRQLKMTLERIGYRLKQRYNVADTWHFSCNKDIPTLYK